MGINVINLFSVEMVCYIGLFLHNNTKKSAPKPISISHADLTGEHMGVDIPSKRTYHFIEECITKQSSCIAQRNVYDNKRKNAWRSRGSKFER